MNKIIKKLVTTLLMAILIFASAEVFADSKDLDKSKTNKLSVGKDVYDNVGRIETELKKNKSVTYTVEVPKGTLYLELNSNTSFKVQVTDSKNKVVKKYDAKEVYREEFSHGVIGGISVSKGKYKIKITVGSKYDSNYIFGKVVVLNNSTSRKIAADAQYQTGVTKGKTYKLSFEVETKGDYYISNDLMEFDAKNLYGKEISYKVLDSKGKEVKASSGIVKLSKGTYTITFKAGKTGCVTTSIWPY